MQSMWQCICSDRQFANIWKLTPEKSCTIATNATLHLFWQAIWEDVWKLTLEKNRSNSTNETIYIFPIIILKVQYRVQYFKSLVDPPGWGTAWSPGWWRIGRRPLSAPPHSLRICGYSRCGFALCLEHFSILDTASNVLVYLPISGIKDTFCHFEWMISSCTWCFSQFGIVVQTTGKLLHTLV